MAGSSTGMGDVSECVCVVCVCVCACVCVHATLEENVSTLGRILAWHPSKLPFFRYEVNMYLEERVAGTFL